MPSLPVTSLRVATSDSARDLQVDQADLDRLRSAVEQRVVAHGISLRHKLVIVERLSQGKATLDDLRQHASALDKPTYQDLVEERHSEGFCPYAACGNKAATKYDPESYQAPPADDDFAQSAAAAATATTAAAATKFKLRPDGGLYDVADLDKHGKGAYCSKECLARSLWYRDKCVGTDRTEMLEDIEYRRQQVAQSARDLERESPQDFAARSTDRPAGSMETADNATKLVAQLKIQERTTSPHSEAPCAPSVNAPDFERPLQPGHAKPAIIAASSPPSRPRKRPSAGSPALASFNASLDTTTRPVTASPAPKPVPSPPVRLPGQTDEDVPQPIFSTEPVLVDEHGTEVEWAAQLDDEGESDEVRAWMEQALEVRRMVREGNL
ncbi:hypothetical protein OIV83_003049 [Microbotryomycetes sp. JL201]|nr:hypothetical protein OIV83_003049 [Microbotryomycetes sp. JL201]